MPDSQGSDHGDGRQMGKMSDIRRRWTFDAPVLVLLVPGFGSTRTDFVKLEEPLRKMNSLDFKSDALKPFPTLTSSSVLSEPNQVNVVSPE